MDTHSMLQLLAFTLGFVCAVCLFALVHLSTGEAQATSQCGNSSYNPCYVKVVE
tara:strand:- start:207 stop:368 length:162 start_codon:yes stop_codon:yes gene_type:complete